MTRRSPCVIAIMLCCLLPITTSASAETRVPPHLADSWAKCEAQARARFGSSSTIQFGPDPPKLDVGRGVGYLFGAIIRGRSSHRFACEMKTDGRTFRVTRLIAEVEE